MTAHPACVRAYHALSPELTTMGTRHPAWSEEACLVVRGVASNVALQQVFLPCFFKNRSQQPASNTSKQCTGGRKPGILPRVRTKIPTLTSILFRLVYCSGSVSACTADRLPDLSRSNNCHLLLLRLLLHIFSGHQPDKLPIPSTKPEARFGYKKRIR